MHPDADVRLVRVADTHAATSPAAENFGGEPRRVPTVGRIGGISAAFYGLVRSWQAATQLSTRGARRRLSLECKPLTAVDYLPSCARPGSTLSRGRTSTITNGNRGEIGALR
jgi:hypothetical protein